MSQNIWEAVKKELYDRWSKFEESYVAATVQVAEQFYDALKLRKKEATIMKATCNGFTGELVKLERKDTIIMPEGLIVEYDITLYDSEKQATISFTGVKMEDVKFLGGAVTFG